MRTPVDSRCRICKRYLGPGRIACRRAWYALPPSFQDAVRQGYRLGGDALVFAVEQCVEYWREHNTRCPRPRSPWAPTTTPRS